MATPTLPGVAGYVSSTGQASSSVGTDAPTTPAASATTPAVAGPNAAALNPAASSVSANTLDPGIANKPLPGAAAEGATPAKAGTPAVPYDEQQIVSELAKELNVKAPKGGSIETAVIEALAKQHGVQIPKPTQTEGTGTGQGAVGQLRHNIASWFDSALNEANNPSVPGSAKPTKDLETPSAPKQ